MQTVTLIMNYCYSLTVWIEWLFCFKMPYFMISSNLFRCENGLRRSKPQCSALYPKIKDLELLISWNLRYHVWLIKFHLTIHNIKWCCLLTLFWSDLKSCCLAKLDWSVLPFPLQVLGVHRDVSLWSQKDKCSEVEVSEPHPYTNTTDA